MIRDVFTSVAIVCIFFFGAGCGGESRKWEIAAENRGGSPCSIAVAYDEDGSGSARVDPLAKGPPQVLIAGAVETPLRSVTVKVGKDEHTPKPDVRLTAGKRYTVVVAADGKASVVMSDK